MPKFSTFNQKFARKKIGKCRILVIDNYYLKFHSNCLWCAPARLRISLLPSRCQQQTTNTIECQSYDIYSICKPNAFATQHFFHQYRHGIPSVSQLYVDFIQIARNRKVQFKRSSTGNAKPEVSCRSLCKFMTEKNMRWYHRQAIRCALPWAVHSNATMILCDFNNIVKDLWPVWHRRL